MTVHGGVEGGNNVDTYFEVIFLTRDTY